MEEKRGGETMRQTNKAKDLSVKKKDKSSGFFLKILMVVLIPLLFASAILLIIAKVTDVNVFDKAKELSQSLPFINEPLEEKTGNDIILEERVVGLQAEIKEKEAQVFQLQQQLDASADEKEALLIEQERLLYEIEVLEQGTDSTKHKLSDVISTFEKMSAKSAAPVITNMSDAEAIQILTSLKPDVLASILERMSPEDAANYTSMLTK